MKLSDKDLHYALWCAENHTGNSLYTEAMADLEEGTLEIEGYIRDEWTKFEPDDPKTSPKEGTSVLVITYNDLDKWECQAGRVSENFVRCHSIFSNLTGSSIFWREVMFPKPPVESEAKDEAE